MTERRRPHPSPEELVDRLTRVSDAMIELVASADAEAWNRSPAPGAWSPGKEADHVADALPLHLWFVRKSLGERAGSRPAIERATLTTDRSPAEVAERIRRERDTAVALVSQLTNEQLELPSNPPRGRHDRVAELLQSLVIGHLETHRRSLDEALET